MLNATVKYIGKSGTSALVSVEAPKVNGIATMNDQLGWIRFDPEVIALEVDTSIELPFKSFSIEVSTADDGTQFKWFVFNR